MRKLNIPKPKMYFIIKPKGVKEMDRIKVLEIGYMQNL